MLVLRLSNPDSRPETKAPLKSPMPAWKILKNWTPLTNRHRNSRPITSKSQQTIQSLKPWKPCYSNWPRNKFANQTEPRSLRFAGEKVLRRRRLGGGRSTHSRQVLAAERQRFFPTRPLACTETILEKSSAPAVRQIVLIR